jgi:hypothetical protein
MADDLEILKQALLHAEKDGEVAAQVFLGPEVSEDELVGTVFRAAQGRLAIGRVTKLANAVAVTGSAEVVYSLMGQPGIRTVLPSEQDDILPRPL